MTVRYDYLGRRYDDRFVCQWHIYRDEQGWPTHMGWCGLDCPVQRMRVAEAFLQERRWRPHPQWDSIAGGAA